MKKVTIKLPDAMYEVIMKSGDSKNYLIKAIQNGEVCDERAKREERDTIRSAEAGDIRGD
jgi:cellobiose-specific phosphotransferase system component IIA